MLVWASAYQLCLYLYARSTAGFKVGLESNLEFFFIIDWIHSIIFHDSLYSEYYFSFYFYPNEKVALFIIIINFD